MRDERQVAVLADHTEEAEAADRVVCLSGGVMVLLAAPHQGLREVCKHAPHKEGRPRASTIHPRLHFSLDNPLLKLSQH